MWQDARRSRYPDPSLGFAGVPVSLSLAPEQREKLPPWCVLLGAVVPMDGAWGATGTMLQVSPSEADI